MHELVKNVNDIKSRYLTMNKSFQVYSLEKKQLQLKISALEEDNIQLNANLQESIKNQEEYASKTAKVNRNITYSRSKRTNSNNDDNQKQKGEALRKALVMEDNIDEALDLDSLLHSTSSFAVTINYLLQFIPFKDDIRQVQAKHGGSVAAYFVFTRFMFLQFAIISLFVLGIIICY